MELTKPLGRPSVYHPQALLEETIQHLRRREAADDVIELLERSV